jgi:hypothetical protein
MAAFDPDAYLAAQPAQAAFDPDAYLKSKLTKEEPKQLSGVDALSLGLSNVLNAGKDIPQQVKAGIGGLGQGVGNVAVGAQNLVGIGLERLGASDIGQWLRNDATQGKAKLQSEVAPMAAEYPMSAGVGRMAGELAMTLPIGGVLGKVAAAIPGVATKAAPLIQALRTSGMTTGAAPIGLASHAGDLGLRSLAGAAVGGTSAALLNPENASLGALIGGGLPIAASIFGQGANTLGSMLRPFTSKGQDKVLSGILRDFSENPENALAQLLQAKEIVKGSAPNTAMAAGDTGIASLSRAMQNADQRFASELAARQTAQNQARTVALDSIAGNDAKIAIAKEARDTLTGPMRESVLQTVKNVKAEPLLSSIDNLLSKPENAGKLSQQALQEFRGNIAKFTKDDAINARALYAIRKDINDVLGGKLQGEAGNLKQASSQLIEVKGLIDDAIDKASKAIPNEQKLLAGNMPRSSWADYLQTYAKESIPIRQMERLDKVMKSIQTGSVDSQGGLILSGAKLNNILKNEGSELIKSLSPEQIDILRRVSADLNASQIAANTGRAVGSNTLQNMAQNNILAASFGKELGSSTTTTSTLGRLLNLPYGTANKQMQEKLGNALLDPQEAARIWQTPTGNKLYNYLTQTQLPYKLAPVIPQ